MINIDYVNGSINLETEHIFSQYNSFMESCTKDIDNMFADFDLLQEKVTLESAIMDDVPESLMTVYEAGKKNIFTSIGEAIIKLYNAIKKVIDDVIDWFKNLTLKNKTNMQKAQLLAKRYPDFADTIVGSFSSGALDLSDIKNIKELDKVADEIAKMVRNNEDPKSIESKIDKAKKKFEETARTADNVTTTLNAGKAIVTFIPAIAGAIVTMKGYRADRQKRMEEAVKTFEQFDKKDEIPNDNRPHGARLMLQFNRFIDSKFSNMTKDTTSLFGKISNKIAELVDKHAPKLSEKLESNYKGVKSKVESSDKLSKADKEAEAEARRKEKEAEDNRRLKEKRLEIRARQKEKDSERRFKMNETAARRAAAKQDAYGIAKKQEEGRIAARKEAGEYKS